MGETTGTDSTAGKAPKSQPDGAIEATNTTPEEGEPTPTVEVAADSPPTELADASSDEVSEVAAEEDDLLAGEHEILRHRASRSLKALVRRPGARLGFALALTLALLGTAGAAGAYVVPHTAGPAVPQALEESESQGKPSEEGLGDDLDPAEGLDPTDQLGEDPFLDGLPEPTTLPVGRPADSLAPWALSVTSKVGIPQVAMEAYGYAELVMARTTPSCGLKWTTLAGIGKVESNHGRTGGSTLTPDGKALPPIRGLPLNGKGVDAIPDTDGGLLDGDSTWDRAVGPMQFIPSTWNRHAVDADNDGVKDPNDLDDAALTAATYLCASGKNVSTASGWYAAVLSYNAVRVYASEVFAIANDYGVSSRK